MKHVLPGIVPLNNKNIAVLFLKFINDLFNLLNFRHTHILLGCWLLSVVCMRMLLSCFQLVSAIDFVLLCDSITPKNDLFLFEFFIHVVNVFIDKAGVLLPFQSLTWRCVTHMVAKKFCQAFFRHTSGINFSEKFVSFWISKLVFFSGLITLTVYWYSMVPGLIFTFVSVLFLDEHCIKQFTHIMLRISSDQGFYKEEVF